MQEVEDKVRDIISEVVLIPREKIQFGDRLTDIVSDSIQLFELLLRFEEELGRKVSYDEIVNIDNVGDVVRVAQEHLYVANQAA